ncbi:MAG: PAS domain S-box protein [Myxococcota bacterium]|nr:PAS domain S-box protein [Myxococcota bacterium]
MKRAETPMARAYTRDLARDLERELAEAKATIEALVSGQIDAVFDAKGKTLVLLFKAQQALRESEERHRRIVETANEGILTVDAGSTVTFVNRRLAEMLGQSVDEIPGQSLFELMPSFVRGSAALRVERSRQGISEEGDIVLLRKDGSELCALLKTAPIRDTDGKYVGTLAMMTDRSGHKETELALRKSEEQYRQIVEATSDGIIKVEDDDQIVFVNRRCAEMLGCEPGEMLGRSLFAFMSAEAKNVAMPFLQGRAPVQGAFDATFRHKNGADISVNLAPTLLASDDGRRVTLAVVRDETERRKMQSELMVSDRMASMGTLAAGVAHEINNPLAAVIANLDYIAAARSRMMGDDRASLSAAKSAAWLFGDIEGPLDDAREGAERMRLIVRDLKSFSRSPSDELNGLVDVNAVMDSSLRMAWNEIRHRARLVKAYGRVPPVVGNEARIGQVFLNLIVNAAQALQEGHAQDNEIRVATRHEGGLAIVEVIDTGPGIPPEIIGRIFDAFFTTKAAGVGTGLGLAICQRIVFDMGGELTVESALGKGTTFRVALRITGLKSEPIGAAPASVGGRRGRILVVDDERLVIRAVERTLSEDHDVVTVVAAREALALCAAGAKFDLILCDLMMPDMTGMDLHRELSVVVPEQATKMIFLTGGAFTTLSRQFLSDTPKEHLEKPFDPANLKAVVRRYLR